MSPKGGSRPGCRNWPAPNDNRGQRSPVPGPGFGASRAEESCDQEWPTAEAAPTGLPAPDLLRRRTGLVGDFRAEDSSASILIVEAVLPHRLFGVRQTGDEITYAPLSYSKGQRSLQKGKSGVGRLYRLLADRAADV